PWAPGEHVLHVGPNHAGHDSGEQHAPQGQLTRGGACPCHHHQQVAGHRHRHADLFEQDDHKEQAHTVSIKQSKCTVHSLLVVPPQGEKGGELVTPAYLQESLAQVVVARHLRQL